MSARSALFISRLAGSSPATTDSWGQLVAIAIQQLGGIGVYPGVFKMSIYSYLNQQVAVQSFHMKISVTGGAGNDALGTILVNWYTGNWDVAWKPVIATPAVILGAKMFQENRSPVILPGIITDGSNGTGGTSAMATQVSGLIRTVTEKGGRAYRGRMFVPFPTTAFQDTNLTPTTVYVGLLNDIVSDVISPIAIAIGPNSYQLSPTLYHRKAGKGGVPAAGSDDLIVSAAGQKIWATMRKRGDLGRLNPPFIS